MNKTKANSPWFFVLISKFVFRQLVENDKCKWSGKFSLVITTFETSTQETIFLTAGSLNLTLTDE